jgi:hypothetical protein
MEQRPIGQKYREVEILSNIVLLPHALGSPVRSRVVGISFIALALVWAISDFRLVFLRNYEKDSDREACSAALARARHNRLSKNLLTSPLKSINRSRQVPGTSDASKTLSGFIWH